MPLEFAAPDSTAIPLHLVDTDTYDSWRAGQGAATRQWLDTVGFAPTLGSAVLVPDAAGNGALALAGFGDASARARSRFALAAAAARLPAGTYALANALPAGDLATEALGWLLTGYAFDRYKKQAASAAKLVCPDGLDGPRIEAIANAEALIRDLINTPTSDLGPEELEQAARAEATNFGADISVTQGDDLLAQNLPLIHAVGRASDAAPRLIDMRWGNSGPKLTLVGKGVCFDTGGLNLKPGASLALMKKDWGGAATVLGLARMIMALNLPLQLRVLIPAVENAVSGNAFRPGDILTSRKGLTIEINNTDAEGRLVLADALTLADEEKPDMVISMATLTGAARVAVGPDLSPYFTNDEDVSTALAKAATTVSDPVWRLPFWEPYEKMIEPVIADLDNAPKGGFAGSITAALFLRRFCENRRYTHFDIYGWNPAEAPGRSLGGTGMGARTLLQALPDLLGL